MDAPKATESPAFEFYWVRLPQAFAAHRDFPKFRDGSILATLLYLCHRINRKSGKDGCFLTFPTALVSIAEWCHIHFGTAQRAVDRLLAWKPDGQSHFLEQFIPGGGRTSTTYRFNFLALTMGTAKYARGSARALTQRKPRRSGRVSAGANRYTTGIKDISSKDNNSDDVVAFQILKGCGVDGDGMEECLQYPIEQIERARDYLLARKSKKRNRGGYMRLILRNGWAENPDATKPAAKKTAPTPAHSAKRPATKPAEAEIDTTTDVFTAAKARLKSAPKPLPKKRYT